MKLRRLKKLNMLIFLNDIKKIINKKIKLVPTRAAFEITKHRKNIANRLYNEPGP